MKYIDADLLRKEIEKNKNMIDGLFTEGDDSTYDGEDDAYNRVLRIIDSLQQEQSKVDLNEEIERFIDAHYHTRFDETLENGNDPLTVFDFEDIARHFYELGLRRAAEMYDEIEYNRQREEEE